LKIYKFKSWLTIAIIGSVAIVISIYTFAFDNSNKVKAAINENRPEIESGKLEEPENPQISSATSENTEKDEPPDSVNAELTSPNEPQISSSQPSNGQPSSSQPSNGQPSSSQPSNGQLPNGQPSSSQPSNGQLPNGQPSNSQPVTPENSNYKEFFKDDAFLGDSISEGLSYYDFLDDNRVIAGKGLSIIKGIDESDKIIALQPHRVFILFGVNDIDDRTPSSWLVEQYTTLVVKLKTKLPNSKIYVISILPVLEKLVNNPHINNVHINECNLGLINMASLEDVNYINLGALLNDSNKNLYEGDGIHYKSDFYTLWLDNLESVCKVSSFN